MLYFDSITATKEFRLFLPLILAHKLSGEILNSTNQLIQTSVPKYRDNGKYGYYDNTIAFEYSDDAIKDLKHIYEKLNLQTAITQEELIERLLIKPYSKPNIAQTEIDDDDELFHEYYDGIKSGKVSYERFKSLMNSQIRFISPTA